MRKEIRQRALQQRAALPEAQRAAAAREITKRLLASTFLEHAEPIGLYASYGHEVATTEIAQELWAQKKTLAFPMVLERREGLTMTFHCVAGPLELRPGFKGILEPKAEIGSSIEPPLLLVPGLAFSTDGMRLGYGAGTYDRYVGACQTWPVLVALAFECQITPNLPALPHDVPVDAIVTEKRTIICRKKGEA